MATSSLIKEAVDVDVGKLFRGSVEPPAPRPGGGGSRIVLDEEPEVSSLLAPPEPSLVERRSSLTKEEADETLEFANTLDYDELGDVSFVRTGAPVQSSPGDQLLQWYDEVNTMSPAPIKQRRVKSDNAFQSKAKSSVRQEEWDAQDTQMMLDNRRFYPDRVFAEGQAEKLWSYLGDDFLADGEGNPVVLFRTGSQLGEQGYPRAFGGGNEFSAHFGTRSAALNVQEFGRTMSFGGPGKYVDVYYTNVKAPFQVPDLGQWYSESVLSAVLRNTQATEGMKRELLKVQREYEEVARVVLQPTGIDTSRSTLNEMMLEMNEFNGKGLERTQTSLRAAMSKDIKRVLSDAGYDSLSYRNEHEGKGSLSFLPFSPNQVKSIKNVGTFNPRNENVLKSILGGTVVGAGAAEQQDTGGDT